MRPAGAFLNTVLLMPRWKFSMTKIAIASFSTFCPKYGSHRAPRLSVTRLDTRQESCPYRPMCQLFTSTLFGPPCSTLVTRPTRRSASPRPVADPLTIQFPLARDVEV